MFVSPRLSTPCTTPFQIKTTQIFFVQISDPTLSDYPLFISPGINLELLQMTFDNVTLSIDSSLLTHQGSSPDAQMQKFKGDEAVATIAETLDSKSLELLDFKLQLDGRIIITHLNEALWEQTPFSNQNITSNHIQ